MRKRLALLAGLVSAVAIALPGKACDGVNVMVNSSGQCVNLDGSSMSPSVVPSRPNALPLAYALTVQPFSDDDVWLVGWIRNTSNKKLIGTTVDISVIYNENQLGSLNHSILPGVMQPGKTYQVKRIIPKSALGRYGATVDYYPYLRFVITGID